MRKEQAAGKGVRNIAFLGLVSFFMDLSSEMVYPLIPIYLTSVLGATPTIIGVIEGIAESIASLLKVFSGYVSDRYQRKKPIAFVGYATGLLYKIAMLFAASWPGVLVARIVDRFGKGIRTAPRDVMVADSADSAAVGKSFGLHKMLDMAGSAAGVLLAFFLFTGLGQDAYRTVFAASMILATLSLCMFFFIKETKEPRQSRQREKFWLGIKGLNHQLKLYLCVSFLFTLGNSSNSFLLLRAADVGISEEQVILLYFVFNTTASLLSIPFGKWSDRIGRKNVMILGYVMFAAVYLVFAAADNPAMIVAAFFLYGIYTAMITGAEKAFIAEIAPKELKGTMLGLHSTLVGIALLPASVIAGLLWDYIGTYAPFLFGAAVSLAAALALKLGLKGKPETAA